MTVVALDLKDASAHIVSQRMHMDIALDQSLRGIEMPETIKGAAYITCAFEQSIWAIFLGHRFEKALKSLVEVGMGQGFACGIQFLTVPDIVL